MTKRGCINKGFIFNTDIFVVKDGVKRAAYFIEIASKANEFIPVP